MAIGLSTGVPPKVTVPVTVEAAAHARRTTWRPAEPPATTCSLFAQLVSWSSQPPAPRHHAAFRPSSKRQSAQEFVSSQNSIRNSLRATVVSQLKVAALSRCVLDTETLVRSQSSRTERFGKPRVAHWYGAPAVASANSPTPRSSRRRNERGHVQSRRTEPLGMERRHDLPVEISRSAWRGATSPTPGSIPPLDPRAHQVERTAPEVSAMRKWRPSTRTLHRALYQIVSSGRIRTNEEELREGDIGPKHHDAKRSFPISCRCLALMTVSSTPPRACHRTTERSAMKPTREPRRNRREHGRYQCG